MLRDILNTLFSQTELNLLLSRLIFHCNAVFWLNFLAVGGPLHCTTRAISMNSKIKRQNSSSHFPLIAENISICERQHKAFAASSDKGSWSDQSRRLLWDTVFIIWRKSFVTRLLNVSWSAFCSQGENASFLRGFSPLWALNKDCELPPLSQMSNFSSLLLLRREALGNRRGTILQVNCEVSSSIP